MIHKRQVILISSILSISLLGDAFLYLALPLYYVDFNLSLFWVGIILSLNRFARILLNPLIIYLIGKYGFKKLIIIASMLATISTSLYGVSSFIAWFLVARIIWAISYSILRVSTLSYATYNKSKSGYYLGIYQTVHEIAPIMVLLLGPFLIQIISIKLFFILLGLLTLASVPLSFMIKDISITSFETKRTYFPKINFSNTFMFSSALFTEGILIVSIGLIFLSQGVLKETAILYASIIIILKRIINLFFGIKIGQLYDTYPSAKILFLSTISLIIGSFFMTFDFIWAGSIILMITFTVINIGLPKFITEQSNDRLHALNDMTTWRDIAAASGALFGASFFETIDYHVLFGISTLIWMYYLIMWYQVTKQKVIV